GTGPSAHGAGPRATGGTGARSFPGAIDSCCREHVVLELLAQVHLLHLAGGTQGYRVDEHHVVRNLPLGDFSLIERQQFFARDFCARLLHHHHDGSLVPLGVLHAHTGGHGHRRVGHGDVLHVDGTDPLATGLDHVLAAVGDLHEAVSVDGGHVASGEPALALRVVAQRVAALSLEVAGNDPGTAHQQ